MELVHLLMLCVGSANTLAPADTVVALEQLHVAPCRRKQLLELVYETIREKYGGIAAPLLLMKLAAKPREWLLKRVRDIRHNHEGRWPRPTL